VATILAAMVVVILEGTMPKVVLVDTMVTVMDVAVLVTTLLTTSLTKLQRMHELLIMCQLLMCWHETLHINFFQWIRIPTGQ